MESCPPSLRGEGANAEQLLGGDNEWNEEPITFFVRDGTYVTFKVREESLDKLAIDERATYYQLDFSFTVSNHFTAVILLWIFKLDYAPAATIDHVG